MPYRMAVYGWLAAQKLNPQRIRQVVLHLGQPPIRMVDRLDLGDLRVAYRLIDIREFAAATLLKSGNPGDYAPALLASGGTGRLRRIVEQAAGLPDPQRRRVLTQLAVLSWLRGVSERLKTELKKMSVIVDIEKKVILRDIRDAGKAEGMLAVVRYQLESRFGSLPKWASQRLDKATPAQLERWVGKVLTAATLEGVLGKK